MSKFDTESKGERKDCANKKERGSPYTGEFFCQQVRGQKTDWNIEHAIGYPVGSGLDAKHQEGYLLKGRPRLVDWDGLEFKGNQAPVNDEKKVAKPDREYKIEPRFCHRRKDSASNN